MKKTLITLIILIQSLIAFSQVTETKEVKISVLKSMGKDLEKFKSLKEAYQLKSSNMDSLIDINIKLFNDLDLQQKERIKIQSQLNELNKDYLKAVKKKGGWLVPTLIGIIAGTVLGVSI